MSCGQRGVKQSALVYVISICWTLLVAIILSVDGLEEHLEYEPSYSLRIREKRQQIPFPLDQIFQINGGEIDVSSQMDSENDFNSAPGMNGNGLQGSQDDINTAVQQQELQSRLPQLINNLIEAAAVQQPPVPQQLVRTVMNSGLRR